MPLSGVRIRLVNVDTEQPVAVVYRARGGRTTLLLDRRFTRGQRVAAALRLLLPGELDRLACSHHVATRCSHAYRSLPFTTVEIASSASAASPPLAVGDRA